MSFFKRTIFFLLTFASINLSGLIPINYQDEAIEGQESYISALGALTYYMQETGDDKITFTDEELANLWEKAARYIHCDKMFSANRVQKEIAFEQSFKNYINLKSNKFHEKTSSQLSQDTALLLCELWEQAIEEEKTLYVKRAASQKNVRIHNEDFENNTVIPKKVKKKLRPFVILDSHPKKAALDAIFKPKRVTYDEELFIKAGFEIISKRPRSYVYVALHPNLNGYLVKAYMDTEKRLKQYKESWDWLTQRCIGAKKIREIIKYKKIKHFTVASKWIYPLPTNNIPKSDHHHTLHYAILLAEDMQLVSKNSNLNAWSTVINTDYLNELYTILSRAKGSSYRPDNIWYTKQNTFAFIDTEYPNKGPDYYSIRKHLSPEMKAYWDKLVKNGLR